MSASLVGSEMCIRDSEKHEQNSKEKPSTTPATRASARACACDARAVRAVSYTHLTLPTICSV
eukprot:2783322-Alexandrium_andersonii.AAC.1